MTEKQEGEAPPAPSLDLSDTKGDAKGKGLADGERFTVPETTSFVDELTNPKALLSLPTQVYVVAFTLTGLTLFMQDYLPKEFYIVNFLFWRLCYNAGIGWMLHTQSNGMLLSNTFKKLSKEPQYKWLVDKLESGIIVKQEGKQVDYKMANYPHEFNTWIVFRIVVNIILANDLVSYLIFAVVYIEVPENIGIKDVVAYLAGICLMGFALWSKSDAHRVLGNFAWYWGDFFFTLEGDLTFDGIFQMFPHPMYTVGYCFYYGCALMSQSYTVFYCSVFAHILQMVFLVVVENPHIEKIYGQLGTPTQELREKEELTFRDQWGFFSAKRDMILLFNLSPFHAADIFTVLILMYSTIIAFSISSWEWHLLHLIFWRLFHTAGLGIIMHRQATDGFWVKKFSSAQSAFDNWKKIYNLSLTMNHALFSVLAMHCFRFMPDNTIIMPGDYPFYCFKFFCGMLLLGLNIYVSNAVHCVLGDFGWFYGDFFVTSIPAKLSYSGIYRYLNNPEAVMGYAGYYGAALMSSSYRVGIVAVCCHISALLFSKFVEQPFMEKKYGPDVRRVGGLQSEVLKKTKLIQAETLKTLKAVEGIVNSSKDSKEKKEE